MLSKKLTSWPCQCGVTDVHRHLVKAVLEANPFKAPGSMTIGIPDFMPPVYSSYRGPRVGDPDFTGRMPLSGEGHTYTNAPPVPVRHLAVVCEEVQGAGLVVTSVKTGPDWANENHHFQTHRECAHRWEDLANRSLRLSMALAIGAHAHQRRKYTYGPYVDHCIEVMQIVTRYTADKEVACAALLHDTIEDTELPHTAIYEVIGGRVRDFVVELTDEYDHERYPGWSRRQRKEYEVQRLVHCSPEARLVKLADIASNLKNLAAHDPGFARVMAKEVREFVEAQEEPAELVAEVAAYIRALDEPVAK